MEELEHLAKEINNISENILSLFIDLSQEVISLYKLDPYFYEQTEIHHDAYDNACIIRKMLKPILVMLDDENNLIRGIDRDIKHAYGEIEANIGKVQKSDKNHAKKEETKMPEVTGSQSGMVYPSAHDRKIEELASKIERESTNTFNSFLEIAKSVIQLYQLDPNFHEKTESHRKAESNLYQIQWMFDWVLTVLDSRNKYTPYANSGIMNACKSLKEHINFIESSREEASASPENSASEEKGIDFTQSRGIVAPLRGYNKKAGNMGHKVNNVAQKRIFSQSLRK